MTDEGCLMPPGRLTDITDHIAAATETIGLPVLRLRRNEMTGVDLVAKERSRQVLQEGWSSEHDDSHRKGELAQAAACYAWPPMRPAFVKKAWPWDRQKWWKPELFGIGASEKERRQARIRVLVKAGALIAAEIDRLLRVADSREK